MPYSELKIQVIRLYGNFRGLQVNELNEFLQESSYHTLQGPDNSDVAQTEFGCQVAYNCFRRVLHSAELRRDLYVSKLPKEEVGNRAVQEVIPASEIQPCTSSTAADRVAEWVDNTQTQLVPPSDTLKDVAEVCESTLAQRMNDLDARYAFFLVISRLTPSENLQALANIPWLQVYDFDSESRENGTLSGIEVIMHEMRNLTISGLTEPPKTISDKATHWVFMKGLRENSETACEVKAAIWHKDHKLYLQQYCSTLSKFCSFHKPAVVLVLWYDFDKENTKCLEWLLIHLDQAFSGTSHDFLEKVIICTSARPGENDILQQIVERFDWEDNKITISEKSVCNLLYHQNPSASGVKSLPQFPKLGEDNTIETVSISKQNYAWLNDSLDIMAICFKDDEIHSVSTMEEFVKGGVLAWHEVSMNTVAVERSCQTVVYEYIKRECVDACKSAVIRIYHSPGGGGTTFGRQLLWRLRKIAPCAATTSINLSTSGLIERIHFLHNRTLLPVVVLIDGTSDYEVDLLYARTNAAIIVHIQRFSRELKSSSFDPGGCCCYLAGNVTVDESKDLSSVFARFAPSSNSKSTLNKLHKEVSERKTHQVFEFGLAAFNHEFKGVRKYVRGYMEPRTAVLQNWQKAVSYLSLLMFYGQCGISGLVFKKLLQSSDRQHGGFDALHNGRQFIINTGGYWKITYNAVAKEILEFALSVHTDESDPLGRLSSQARDKLHVLVQDFLSYIDGAIGKNASERISYPLSQMVLKRDFDDAEVIDDLSKKKKLSSLLADIKGEDNHIKVLEQFTETFPQNAELRAHLGRLYGMYGLFKKAEKAFKVALDLRSNERIKQDPEKTDNVRGRFHHMFGFSYLEKIRHDCKQKDAVTNALASAKKAVNQFAQGRKYAVHNRSYGYIGEVRARLLMVELFVKKYNIRLAFSTKLDSVKDLELLEFVRESHSECDRLLAECQQLAPITDLHRMAHYFHCVSSYNQYFKDVAPAIPEPSFTQPNMRLARSKIASIKMKHKKINGKETYSLDAVNNKQDISDIVQLLESTLREVFSKQWKFVSVSVDMLEWLDAIRHRDVADTYQLTDVLQFVEQWEKRNEFGLATFYFYVINFLMAMWSTGPKQRQFYFDKVFELGKKLRAHSHKHPIHQRSRELLADHANFTIRKLVPKRHVGSWDRENRQWSNREAVYLLQVCTGTVVKSHLPTMGFIELDVPNQIHNRTVEIYFVPKRHNLHGQRFVDKRTRVEFFIVFNTHNGAEAEAVTELGKRLCPTCKVSTEMITLNQTVGGKCIKCGGKHK